MTSRQRLLKTLNHQIPDRVPIDFGGFQTGIHKKAYIELLDYLGIDDEPKILDPVQQLVVPCEELLQRFHIDIRYVCAHGPDSFKACPERNRRSGIEKNKRDGKIWHELEDEFGIVWSMPAEQGLYMDISHHPLADATVENIDDYPFPNGSDPSRFAGVREKTLQLREQTPYAISTGIGGAGYEYCWYMRGLERWYIDMIENPAFCEALLDKMLKFWIDYYTGFMGQAGDIIDVVMIGDDLAGQSGPLFSPDLYRNIVKPRQKKLVQHIKSKTAAKILYHTCGSCFEYIPDLINNGIDILNPVQIGLVNMEPRKLKDMFGSRVSFWGAGIDAQHILAFAEPSEIREQVRGNLQIFKPSGGYVFNNVHNIQFDVPAENIVALFDAAYEFGFYD